MNRHERRAAAARALTEKSRSQIIAEAIDFLAELGSADPGVSGASLILPSGEIKYLDIQPARAMRSGGTGESN